MGRGFPSGSGRPVMLSSIARAVGLVLLLVYLQMMAIPSPGYGFSELSGGDKDVTGELTRTTRDNGRFAKKARPIYTCLDCNPGIPANCTINSVNETISCEINATLCPLVTCTGPKHCYHIFTLLKNASWKFATECFREKVEEKCVFETVVPSNTSFPPVEGFMCQCNNIEDCTLEEPVLYVHSPSPSPSPNPPQEPEVDVPQPTKVDVAKVTTSSSPSPDSSGESSLSHTQLTFLHVCDYVCAWNFKAAIANTLLTTGGGSPLHEKVAIILLPIIATIVIAML